MTPSNILLFHLGIIESLLCIVFLIFSVPLLTRGDENTITNGICNVNAFFVTLLHPIALWTVCGLNFDRYYCISAPLHYNAIVSTNKVRMLFWKIKQHQQQLGTINASALIDWLSFYLLNAFVVGLRTKCLNINKRKRLCIWLSYCYCSLGNYLLISIENPTT